MSRTNIAFGVSDRIMVLFGSALADGINQFKYGIASSIISFRSLLSIFGKRCVW